MEKGFETDDTIRYYNQNAERFVEQTKKVEFHVVQEKFLSYLKPVSLILDFGCGSGRDTKAFLEAGYAVEAIDGSAVLCRIASENTGHLVKQMRFQDLAEKEKYDGIWACASILHLPKRELIQVMNRMSAALKKRGIIYTSFKYGTYAGERNGRFFTDLTEETFAVLLDQAKGLKLEEQWVTKDVRPDRGDELWLNVILRRTETEKCG